MNLRQAHMGLTPGHICPSQIHMSPSSSHMFLSRIHIGGNRSHMHLFQVHICRTLFYMCSPKNHMTGRLSRASRVPPAGGVTSRFVASRARPPPRAPHHPGPPLPPHSRPPGVEGDGSGAPDFSVSRPDSRCCPPPRRGTGIEPGALAPGRRSQRISSSPEGTQEASF
jgi:hypothetical protein